MDTLTLALKAAFLAAFSDAGRFVICSGGVFFLAGKVAAASPWRRIQARRCTNADLKREMRNALRTVMLYGVVSGCLAVADHHGAFPSPAGLSWWQRLSSFVGLVLWQDATFYFLHRALHTRWLWRFHAEHHRSGTPSAWAAFSFSGIEALLQVAFLPLWLLFVPMDRTVLVGFLIFVGLRNAIGHAGVELMPAWWLDRWWSALVTTTVHHDLHHSERRPANFGLYFVCWDRMLGTESGKYRHRFSTVTQDRSLQCRAKIQGEWPSRASQLNMP